MERQISIVYITTFKDVNEGVKEMRILITIITLFLLIACDTDSDYISEGTVFNMGSIPFDYYDRGYHTKVYNDFNSYNNLLPGFTLVSDDDRYEYGSGFH